MKFKNYARSLVVAASLAAAPQTVNAHSAPADPITRTSRVCSDLNGSPELYYRADMGGKRYDVFVSGINISPGYGTQSAYVMAGTNGIYFQANVRPYYFPTTRYVNTQRREGAPEPSDASKKELLRTFALVAIDDMQHRVFARLCGRGYGTPDEFSGAQNRLVSSAQP